MDKNTNYSRIYDIINHVPRGKVATYGQIAKLAGLVNGARQVGYALHNLPEGSLVPWHRIINREGKMSFRQGTPSYSLQKQLLESEGVYFINNKISLLKFQWKK